MTKHAKMRHCLPMDIQIWKHVFLHWDLARQSSTIEFCSHKTDSVVLDVSLFTTRQKAGGAPAFLLLKMLLLANPRTRFHSAL